MITSIHFYSQFAIRTKEIDDELPDNILKQELMTKVICSYIIS